MNLYVALLIYFLWALFFSGRNLKRNNILKYDSDLFSSIRDPELSVATDDAMKYYRLPTYKITAGKLAK